MSIHPSKLAAARLAAAEVFIAEGLSDTSWEDEELRVVAADNDFAVDYTVADGFVSVCVGDRDGTMRATIDFEFLQDLELQDASAVVAVAQRVIFIARKVEAAIAAVEQ